MAIMEEKVKINVGSGKRYITEFLNIDVEERYHPDLIADFRTLTYSDVEEVHARHLLEHFGRDEAIKVLKQWHSWLKVGGLLLLEVPDFEGIIEDWNRNDKYWLVRHAYGSQGEDDWAYHKDGWYEDKFREILPQVGFEIVDMKKTRSRVRISPTEKYALPNITLVARKK